MTHTPCLAAAGIDVGQRFLDVGFAPSGQTFRVANLPHGIESILDRLRHAGITRVVIEAIGPYARHLVEVLVQAGNEVGLVNPRRIKAFRDAEGRRAKTDRLDAALIARFALVMPDIFHALPDAEALALKALATRRRQLTVMIATEKTRLKQTLDMFILRSVQQAIAGLDAERGQIEAELARRIAANCTLQSLFSALTGIKGIGPQVARVLITELPEIGQRDRKTIASLAGLAPHVSQSGNRPPQAHIGGGRPCVRAALYMAALVAIRHDPAMKLAYKTMKDAGKPSKVALIAIARKMIVYANAVAKRTLGGQNDNLDA